MRKNTAGVRKYTGARRGSTGAARRGSTGGARRTNNYFNTLPPEMLTHILDVAGSDGKRLGKEARAALASTCKTWDAAVAESDCELNVYLTPDNIDSVERWCAREERRGLLDFVSIEVSSGVQAALPGFLTRLAIDQPNITSMRLHFSMPDDQTSGWETSPLFPRLEKLVVLGSGYRPIETFRALVGPKTTCVDLSVLFCFSMVGRAEGMGRVLCSEVFAGVTQLSLPAEVFFPEGCRLSPGLKMLDASACTYLKTEDVAALPNLETLALPRAHMPGFWERAELPCLHTIELHPNNLPEEPAPMPPSLSRIHIIHERVDGEVQAVRIVEGVRCFPRLCDMTFKFGEDIVAKRMVMRAVHELDNRG